MSSSLKNSSTLPYQNNNISSVERFQTNLLQRIQTMPEQAIVNQSHQPTPSMLIMTK